MLEIIKKAPDFSGTIKEKRAPDDQIKDSLRPFATHSNAQAIRRRFMYNKLLNSPCQEENKKAPDFSEALHTSKKNLIQTVNEKYLLLIFLSSKNLNRSKKHEKTTVFLCAKKQKFLSLPEAKNRLEKITLYLLISLYEITSRNILILRYSQSQYLYEVRYNICIKIFALSFYTCIYTCFDKVKICVKTIKNYTKKLCFESEF